MSNLWFRMYADVINDPKVMRLPEASRWHWVAVLCVSSSNEGRVPKTADLAFLLRMKEQQAASIIAELAAAGLLDKDEQGFFPHNWNGRQYKSDGSTERVKRFRDRHKGVSETLHETRRNVSLAVTETGPEAEQKQNRAEAEQNAPRAVVSSSEKVLRSDLMELFGSKCPDLGRTSQWLDKGYASSMIVEVVRELLARKPDVASLAYFDAALADRHSKRPETPSERAAGANSINMDSVVKLYAATGVWSKYAGPEPGLTGCRVSGALLEKHGLGVDGQKLRVAV